MEKDKLYTSGYFDNMSIFFFSKKKKKLCNYYQLLKKKNFELFNFLLFVHMHNYQLIGLGLTYNMPSLWV